MSDVLSGRDRISSRVSIFNETTFHSLDFFFFYPPPPFNERQRNGDNRAASSPAVFQSLIFDVCKWIRDTARQIFYTFRCYYFYDRQAYEINRKNILLIKYWKFVTRTLSYIFIIPCSCMYFVIVAAVLHVNVHIDFRIRLETLRILLLYDGNVSGE